ncbi:uncharacterized protein [Physcomitrium patens]|uniref:GTD-binding domain-containing protein n=1 Tax=Physcomitrium patens TaxID=3218 RepID=A0A2K1L9B7_PHYPA|nr:uncharacterized protein LOC112276710 [Physcomitrium patens]PNR62629.1 hypothetical protein PHYPA_001053 [Physcomitrium patens]|eukprot:XP_024364103.1 uncharacterized protein LOC112276710 [Physcomitrella patens]
MRGIFYYLERLGSGVEMAWKSPRPDTTVHWSSNGLLNAFIEVFVAFLVLMCTILNFFTSSFIRLSGLHIPCSCCTHYQKGVSGSLVEESKYSFASPKLKSIDTPVASDACLNGFHRSDECVRETELKKPAYLSLGCNLVGGTLGESSLDDFNYRSQEDVDREQYAKAQELLRALQSESEVMAALYSELEEERNSSATAASEALAMISRLQEEKAAVQMEARQFQRMVMEKAMYDQEAIEVLSEILAKREDEKIALEEELELFKERLDTVLTEERDYAERVGRDYVPMLLLEGAPADEKSTSPKSERADPPVSGRTTPNGRISKDGKITPDGRPGKDGKITPDGRLGKDERITPNGRLAKEEEVEFLDRLYKTKSQLLTALLQEGIHETTSALEESASFANEIHKAMAKVPARAESPPILDHESHKSPLGLGPIKTGREIGLPIPPAVTKKQIAKAPSNDTGKSTDEPVYVSRKPASTITKNQIEKVPAKDGDDPVLVSRKSTPVIGKQTDEVLTKDAENAAAGLVSVSCDPTPLIPNKHVENTKSAEIAADEPRCIAHETALPIIPSVVARNKTESSLGTKTAGKGPDERVYINRETSLSILPSAAVKMQNERISVKIDRRSTDEPLFASLKRRWNARSSQEISAGEALAKAKEDRRIEEKRLSVLEYVRTLEEQLQQQAGRPAVQISRARSVDGKEEDARLRSSGQFERSVSVKSENTGGAERDESVQRRLFADGDSVDKKLLVNSIQDGGVYRVYSQPSSLNAGNDSKPTVDGNGFLVNARKSEDSAEEALFVHDVYEVPHEAEN